MNREPVAIGSVVTAVVSLVGFLVPDLVKAVADVGGNQAVVGAVVTIWGLVTYFVRSKVTPVDTL